MAAPDSVRSVSNLDGVENPVQHALPQIATIPKAGPVASLKMSMNPAEPGSPAGRVSSWAINGLNENTSFSVNGDDAVLEARVSSQSRTSSPVVASLPRASLTNRLRGIKIAGMTGKVGEKMKELDRNGDGVVDAGELTDAVDDLVRVELQAKYWRYYSMIAAFAVVVLSGVLAGLTWGIIEQTKQVKVTNNYMMAAGGSGGVPVVTASYAFRPWSNASDLLTAPPSTLLYLQALKVYYMGQIITTKVNTVLTFDYGNNSTGLALIAEDGVLTVNETMSTFTITNPVLQAVLDLIIPPSNSSSVGTRRALPSCCNPATATCPACGWGGNSVSTGGSDVP